MIKMTDQSYTFYEVSYKKFTAENKDGTGRNTIIDEHVERISADDATEEAAEVKALYRTVQKELETSKSKS